MHFDNEARDAGIKPIIGAELTLREQGTGNRGLGRVARALAALNTISPSPLRGEGDGG